MAGQGGNFAEAEWITLDPNPVASAIALRELQRPRLLFASRQPKPFWFFLTNPSMKLIRIVTSVFLLTSFLHAQEIEVAKPVFFGNPSVKVREYDKASKQWVEVDGFRYSFIVYLRR